MCVGYCSGPIYKLVTTELGGERRFAASVARRLQSLGALTKGDRRAATGADLSMFNYDTVYGRTALRFMYQHICKVRIIIVYKLSWFIHLYVYSFCIATVCLVAWLESCIRCKLIHK